MCKDVNIPRRRFLAAAAIIATASELGTIGLANAQSSKTNSVSVPAIKPGTNTSLGPLKQIDAAL
jgi:hypothetical protein